METCVQNGSVRSCFHDLNRDELTLSHQLFNSGYECGSTKSVARSSLCLKLNSIVGRRRGVGYNMAYRRFQILVVQSTHGVTMYVGRNINWPIK
jgi:hypothetical protein